MPGWPRPRAGRLTIKGVNPDPAGGALTLAVPRVPPVPAILAAVTGVLGALVVGYVGLFILAWSGGFLEAAGWVAVTVPIVLALAMVVGVVMLLVGRSWALASWPSAAAVLATTAIIVLSFTGTESDPDLDLAGTGVAVGVVIGFLPLVTAVLAALPAVRRWVAARQAERAA